MYAWWPPTSATFLWTAFSSSLRLIWFLYLRNAVAVGLRFVVLKPEASTLTGCSIFRSNTWQHFGGGGGARWMQTGVGGH